MLSAAAAAAAILPCAAATATAPIAAAANAVCPGGAACLSTSLAHRALLSHPPWRQPLLLVLCGIQGSGKSTFCRRLLELDPTWEHVCQDTVGGRGRRGTRAQCLSRVSAALAVGRSVVVDRTNADPEQRADFIHAGVIAGAAAHALWLQVPAKECLERVRNRVGHEGGVDGSNAKAAMIVHSTSRRLQPPTRSEGFERVFRASRDADINCALRLYSASSRCGLNAAAAMTMHPSPSAPPTSSQPSAQHVATITTTTIPSTTTTIITSSTTTTSAPTPAAPRNAFQEMMNAARRHAQQACAHVPAKRKAAEADVGCKEYVGIHALLNYVNAPERHPQVVLYHDEDVVVVTDKYPKARFHVLVIARDTKLTSVSALTKADLPLVRHMHETGLRIAREQCAHKADGLLLGFHAVPSMRPLHLHVLSADLLSPHLKHRKHWRSFASPFLLDITQCIAALESDGLVNVDTEDAERLLKGPMECHRCGTAMRNVPELKRHVEGCREGVRIPHVVDLL